MAKLLAASASVLVLLGYLALMRVDPAWGLLHPRGGMAMLGLSLVFANAAIWAAIHLDRPLNFRFQLAAAGWIWIAVQGVGVAYVYSQAGG